MTRSQLLRNNHTTVLIVSYKGKAELPKRAARYHHQLIAICLVQAMAVLLVAALSGCSPSSDSSKSLDHFSKSINYDNEATRIINNGKPLTTITGSDADRLAEFYEKALSEAKLVDIAFLNAEYVGWGDHYRDPYIAGLEMFIKGHKDADAAASVQGQKLMATWKQWFRENSKAIKEQGGR